MISLLVVITVAQFLKYRSRRTWDAGFGGPVDDGRWDMALYIQKKRASDG